MLILGVDPLHPDTEAKIYTVHLPDRFVVGGAVTAATWSVTTVAGVASTKVTVVSSSYVNVGDAEHTAAGTRDGVTYDGPLLSVVVSAAAGAAAGDVVHLEAEVTTDRPEGPLHIVIRLPIALEGH